ncbi:MAG: response regulator, partial [Desulfobacterales bacterium]
MGKILAIDDKPDNLTAISALLESAIPECSVVTASSGAEGIEKAKSELPDTILLDVCMPEVDGYEVCRKLREDESTKHIPIAMLTAIRTDAQSRVKGLALGADAFLSKPIDEAELVAQTKVMLRIKRAEDLLREERGLLEDTVRERTRELRENEERSQALLYSMQSGIVIINPETNKITDVNAYVVDLLKEAPETICTEAYDTYILPAEGHSLVIRAGHPNKNVECVLRAKQGREIPILLDSTSITIHGDEYILTNLVNISEQKRLQKHIDQSRKMESVATLAGGVSHEFNNALMGLSGNVDLLGLDYADDGKIGKFLGNMRISIERMSGLTQKLLAYAKGGKYQIKSLSLNEAIAESLPLITYSFDSAITIQEDYMDDLPYVDADPTQMEMILSAILTNASEAISGPGTIKISTYSRRLDEGFARDKDLTPGKHIVLSIEDDGVGMDEEMKSKIFEPFSTTKFQGRGLGMASVHGIVENHDGHILIDSEVGKGTSVRVYLPAAKGSEARQGKGDAEENSRTVLIIEDEEMVMEVTTELLKKLGYTVLSAVTGGEAIDIVNDYKGDILYALLDIKLPDLGGDAVYPHLREVRPDTKVYVCSGFSIDGPAQE